MPVALPAAGSCSLALHQIVAQDHGAVVKDIVGAVEQGHRAASFGVKNGLPGTGVRVELLPVSPAKRLPALHLMVEPLPQLRASPDYSQIGG